MDKQRKLRVLAVEDEEHVNIQYQLGLPDALFEKEFARDGESALEAYAAQKPDVILLDIMLPNHSGFAILKKIREEFQDQDTCIIMATALSGKEDITDCAKLGISGYIVKPIKIKEIGQKVIDSYKNSQRAA